MKHLNPAPLSRSRLINIRNRRKQALSNKLKTIGYVSMATVVFMSIYTKVSYDFIESIKVSAQSELISPMPSKAPAATPRPTPVTVAVTDARVTKLEKFLTKKGSPLAPFAAKIVYEADKNALDYTKIVAISAIESTYGKNLSGTYNAWNIMEFRKGKRIGARNFDSWEEGITEVSSLLSRAYRANEVKAVQLKYCPSYECSPQWVPMVLSTTDEILEME